jgi:chloramphenicol-sensitive protein RarD
MTQKQLGITCALGAFGMWGVLPIYFKALGSIDPLELLSQRVWWSFVLLLVAAWLSRGFADARRVMRDRRLALGLCVTGVLIALNWLTYIYAVWSGNIAEASLGYFINPLINILFGAIFLRENASWPERAAIAIAFGAIAWEMWGLGRVPMIALSLALSFGAYGIIRKKLGVPSFTGLFIETSLLMPLAVIYIIYLFASGTSTIGGWGDEALLALSGPLTVAPLLLFTAAAMRIRLGTLGFIQYLSPTLTFLLAVGVYNEPISHARVVTFALIWVSLLIVIADAIYRTRRKV